MVYFLNLNEPIILGPHQTVEPIILSPSDSYIEMQSLHTLCLAMVAVCRKYCFVVFG
jgi:hypothetical protein